MDRLILITGLGILFFTQPGVSDDRQVFEDALLTVKPNRCISLHQGQVCYQTVVFSWQLPEPGDYCLFEQNRSEPVKCWMNNDTGEFQYDFASSKGREFQIRYRHNGKVLGLTTVNVAWVYKSRRSRNTGWRLF